jgi:hypothetical protein
LAEVELRGSERQVLRSGEFAVDPAEGFKKAAETGAELRDFLKKNGFSARQVFAGLPTPWLMLKDKTVPRISADNLAGLLRMQAERDFSLQPDELVLDYALGTAGGSDTGDQGALLAATPRDRFQQLALIFKTAGLNLRVVGSTTLALAIALNKQPLLVLTARGADLVVRTRGGVLRPLVLSAQPLGAHALGQLASDALRALALHGASDAAEPVLLWNGAGLAAAGVAELRTAFGGQLQEVPASALRVGLSADQAPALAGALALSFLTEGKQPNALNFQATKLAEPKAGGLAFEPWMVLAGAAVLLLVGWLGYSAFSDMQALADLRAQSAARKKELEEAKTFLARFASAQSWYDKRPNHLDCMKALARVIPEDGSAWIVNLSVKDDSHCTVSIHAVDERVYFVMLDPMEKDPTFHDFKLLYMTRPDRKKAEVSFAVGFDYWKQP